MNLTRHVLTGNGTIIKFSNAETKNKEKIDQIKTCLKELKNLYGEFIVIEMAKSNTSSNKEKVVFFQALKCKNYSRLNYYHIEIRIESNRSAKMFGCQAGQQEALRLFEEICVDRKIPDLTGWKLIFDFNTGKTINGVDEDRMAEYEEIAKKWLLQELPEDDRPIYLDAVKHLSEGDWLSHIYWGDLYISELEGQIPDDKLLIMFKHSTNPHILDTLGEKYLYGHGCSPDYKKAYRYFYHGEKLGNLHSRYHRALMYKNGLYVKRNYCKYVKMIESILDDFWEAGGEELLPVVDIALIERALIEKEKGNFEESLKFAFMAKKANDSRIYRYLAITNMPLILDIIYSIIPFDPHDMDVYDLLYLLKKPSKARFFFNKKTFEVEACDMDGMCVVKFENKYYKNAVEFFNTATLSGEVFYKCLLQIDDVEVVS